MKSILIKTAIILFISLGFTGEVINSYKIEVPEEVPKQEIPKKENPKKDNNASEENDLLSSMTLDEKIAQMLIITFDGNYMTNELSKSLKYKPGGVIFFASNISSYAKTTKLINDIQATASIPMFISIDQEGGRVQRITDKNYASVTKIPSMRDLGNMNDVSLAYDVGTVIAEELRAFGFNMDFAPVLDVVDDIEDNVIGNRSFSSDPYMVGKLGVSLKKGLESKNVISVYKHFPGHGATKTDSHNELPILNQTKAELLNRDLIPFKNAIDDGASVIMIGHLAVPNITGDNTPASLSKKVITDILKNEMNYKGLVVTDSLQMKAIKNNYTEKEVYETAINAGVDILLMPNSAESAITLIKQSIKEGKIKEEQINNSVRKILALKTAKLSTKNLSKDYIGSTKHKEIISKINVSD